MKQNTSKKWFRTLLVLSISFAMVIGIFGGMKLEAKAANNIIIDVGDPDSMEKFKSIIFNPDDTLTIHDSRESSVMAIVILQMVMMVLFLIQ